VFYLLKLNFIPPETHLPGKGIPTKSEYETLNKLDDFTKNSKLFSDLEICKSVIKLLSELYLSSTRKNQFVVIFKNKL
jgi:hypothetical protein